MSHAGDYEHCENVNEHHLNEIALFFRDKYVNSRHSRYKVKEKCVNKRRMDLFGEIAIFIGLIGTISNAVRDDGGVKNFEYKYSCDLIRTSNQICSSNK